MVVELIPDEEQGGYTARVPDIPAYGEGETTEEAIADLKLALEGYILTFGIDDAMSRINQPGELRNVGWNLAELACA